MKSLPCSARCLFYVTFVVTTGAEVDALGLSVCLCVFIMPPPPLVFGRLQTLLCRQPEQGEEGTISWELGLKQAAKKERKRQGKHI